ncbi:SEC-C domain-containing protein [Nocardia gipuzkoensis]|uniref:SEC-C domain-containing protein n=1 Tax=Nocardia gipuzkoensis TaxID=2749991 RepID=UPI00237EA188|nr:SEC-C domain-containing protein [Nocardia gipuzkoensis]MDE1675301.1 SEC-C domain-containing protein [Nocardia gipuzkoensis]
MADSLTDKAFDLLRTHGPLDDDEWEDLLVTQGLGDADDMWELIDEFDHPWLGILPDGRNIALDTLLEGRMLTHRLTAEEIAAGLIAADPDLSPLLRVDDDTVIDGLGGARVGFTDLDPEIFAGRSLDGYLGRTLLLEPAALADVDAGTLVALEITDHTSRLRIVTGEVAAPDLAEGLARHIDDDCVLEVDEVGWALMSEDPTLFTTPALPLSELIAAAEFSLRGVRIAGGGFDWDRFDTDIATRTIMLRHSLDRDQARTVLGFGALVRAVTIASPERRDTVLTEADLAGLSELADPDTAAAAYRELFTRTDTNPMAVAAVADFLRRHGPRKLTAAGQWLAGKACERLDLVLDAEQHFEDATTADPYWEPAVADLARYATDRGDLTRAVSLLERTSDGPTTQAYALMREASPTEHPGLGRNDRCWCGSGRKYKLCHLGRGELSLLDRARLLYQKAAVHCDELDWQPTRKDLAQIRAHHWDTPAGWWAALDDPFVVDVTLFECGGFDDFLARRGPLLPEHDLLIAQQWQLAPRSVFEIESVNPGTSISVRDLRTGDRHDIPATTISHHLQAGEFYCCHVVPVGDDVLLTGSLEPVSLPHRSRLLEMLESDTTAPRDLVAFLSARFAPPQLVTTSGDPMVFCQAHLTITDPDTVRHHLTEHYNHDTTDRWTWLDDNDTVLGGLRLTGDELIIDAISEPRFDTLLATIRELDPAVGVVAETRTPAADATHQANDENTTSQELSPDHPEIAAFLDQHLRAYENTWIDEPIPALGGTTPRAAVADPTRRDDVIRLIDSFPQDEHPGQMSANRLRHLLGLP